MKDLKLLEPPQQTTEWLDVQLPHGKMTKIAGRTSLGHCVIESPFLEEEDRTWHRLKYGYVRELELGIKIAKIEVGHLILEGLVPIAQQGDIFTCTVDICRVKDN